MIILTGGAGMIGSMIAWHLNTILNKNQFVIVDEFLVPEQEKNIGKRDFIDLIGKNELPNYLKSNSQIEAIIHMGAISATTENNFNNLLKSNIRYSQFLWDWASANQVPLIYASSAATYGDGEFGYKDNSDALLNYKPLNAYGYSKHFFDIWVQNQLQQNLPKPPKWFGLKFFNVYGPNEYHKGRMASVVYNAFNQFKKDGEVRFFKSKNPEYKDGMQLRDFIYVKDFNKALKIIIEKNKIWNKGEIINIGSEKQLSNFQVLKTIQKTFKKKGRFKIVNKYFKPWDSDCWVSDCSHLKKKYKFKIEYNFLNAIKDLKIELGTLKNH